MSIREAIPPASGLYRIGRRPDPMQLPPWEVIRENRRQGQDGRFDDPREEYRVLYAAEQRIACFVEVLAPYRPDLRLLAMLQAMPDAERGDDVPRLTTIPAGWHESRLIACFRLADGQRWLDLRAHETLEALRWEMAAEFQALGYEDFDLGTVLSSDRRLAQLCSRWAYDRGYQGIAYTSRYGSDLDCWAIFEGARFSSVSVSSIAVDDADLLQATRRSGIPSSS